MNTQSSKENATNIQSFISLFFVPFYTISLHDITKKNKLRNQTLL